VLSFAVFLEQKGKTHAPRTEFFSLRTKAKTHLAYRTRN